MKIMQIRNGMVTEQSYESLPTDIREELDRAIPEEGDTWPYFHREMGIVGYSDTQKEDEKLLLFSYDRNGTCTLHGSGLCVHEHLIIPAYAPTGDEVVGVDPLTLYMDSDVRSITFLGPETHIGYSAFQGCTRLEQVTFCGDVILHDTTALQDCPCLRRVNIWGSVIPFADPQSSAPTDYVPEW